MRLPQTIDEVLETLDEIIKSAVRHNSTRAYFAYVYRRTTAEIKRGVEARLFEDNARMERFDVYFANLYIQAYYDYTSGKEVSNSWKTAFDASRENLCIAQHITLGMNAHINLDLGVAAAHICEGKSISDLEADFRKVNEILFSLTEEMQKGLGKVSGMMFLADWLGRNSDEKLINFSIAKAREFSWLSANRIWVGETKEQRMETIHAIDKDVAAFGGMLQNPKGTVLKIVLWIIRSFEVKEVVKVIDAMKKAGE